VRFSFALNVVGTRALSWFTSQLFTVSFRVLSRFVLWFRLFVAVVVLSFTASVSTSPRFWSEPAVLLFWVGWLGLRVPRVVFDQCSFLVVDALAPFSVVLFFFNRFCNRFCGVFFSLALCPFSPFVWYAAEGGRRGKLASCRVCAVSLPGAHDNARTRFTSRPFLGCSAGGIVRGSRSRSQSRLPRKAALVRPVKFVVKIGSGRSEEPQRSGGTTRSPWWADVSRLLGPPPFDGLFLFQTGSASLLVWAGLLSHVSPNPVNTRGSAATPHATAEKPTHERLPGKPAWYIQWGRRYNAMTPCLSLVEEDAYQQNFQHCTLCERNFREISTELRNKRNAKHKNRPRYRPRGAQAALPSLYRCPTNKNTKLRTWQTKGRSLFFFKMHELSSAVKRFPIKF